MSASRFAGSDVYNRWRSHAVIYQSHKVAADIARRMIIFASEDIGNANPAALQVAVAAAQALEFVGLPEAQLNLAQAVTYLATAAKSNASYAALMAAKHVCKSLNEPVPLHLRNAPTPLMKNLGYGKDYKNPSLRSGTLPLRGKYPHQFPNHHVSENYFPEKLKGRKYYYPTQQGEEAKIAQRLKKLRNWTQE